MADRTIDTSSYSEPTSTTSLPGGGYEVKNIRTGEVVARTESSNVSVSFSGGSARYTASRIGGAQKKEQPKPVERTVEQIREESKLADQLYVSQQVGLPLSTVQKEWSQYEEKIGPYSYSGQLKRAEAQAAGGGSGYAFGYELKSQPNTSPEMTPPKAEPIGFSRNITPREPQYSREDFLTLERRQAAQGGVGYSSKVGYVDYGKPIPQEPQGETLEFKSYKVPDSFSAPYSKPEERPIGKQSSEAFDKAASELSQRIRSGEFAPPGKNDTFTNEFLSTTFDLTYSLAGGPIIKGAFGVGGTATSIYAGTYIFGKQLAGTATASEVEIKKTLIFKEIPSYAVEAGISYATAASYLIGPKLVGTIGSGFGRAAAPALKPLMSLAPKEAPYYFQAVAKNVGTILPTALGVAQGVKIEDGRVRFSPGSAAAGVVVVVGGPIVANKLISAGARVFNYVKPEVNPFVERKVVPKADAELMKKYDSTVTIDYDYGKTQVGQLKQQARVLKFEASDLRLSQRDVSSKLSQASKLEAQAAKLYQPTVDKAASEAARQNWLKSIYTPPPSTGGIQTAPSFRVRDTRSLPTSIVSGGGARQAASQMVQVSRPMQISAAPALALSAPSSLVMSVSQSRVSQQARAQGQRAFYSQEQTSVFGQRLTTSQAQTQSQIQVRGSVLGQSQAQFKAQSQAQSQAQVSAQIQALTRVGIRTQVKTKTKTQLPLLPPFGGGEDKGERNVFSPPQKKVKGAYRPSFTSQVFNIRGPRGKSERTGIGIRPIDIGKKGRR